MRLKLDENLPAVLGQALVELGHDVDTVPEEGLGGHPDSQIWQATQTASRFLITQDLDFSDIRGYRPGSHHGLLLVRLADPSRRRLTERIHHLFATEAVTPWPGCFVVATDRKVRIRRPAS